MKTKKIIEQIVVIYAIVDDLFKAISHSEDIRRTMSDAEVITSCLTASAFFGGNQVLACQYLKEHGLIPNMLSKSRFNRRLHSLSELIDDLQQEIGIIFKNLNDSMEYLLDSFPIAVCDNIRIARCRLINSEDYRGYIASKKRYFYGVRIHLLSTKEGIPVEWGFIPESSHDVRGLNLLPLNLPPRSEIYAEKAFNDYEIEDQLAELEKISLEIIRKKKSKREDSKWVHYIKQTTRYFIETVYSRITRKFPKNIHAVIFQGFLLKVSSFIFAYTLENSFL